MAEIFCGLTKDDVPPRPTIEAMAPCCESHPDSPFINGFGYEGGGFGSYKKCMVCGTVFGKTPARDGNDASVKTKSLYSRA